MRDHLALAQKAQESEVENGLENASNNWSTRTALASAKPLTD
jgi:hypothetical protein